MLCLLGLSPLVDNRQELVGSFRYFIAIFHHGPGAETAWVGSLSPRHSGWLMAAPNSMVAPMFAISPSLEILVRKRPTNAPSDVSLSYTIDQEPRVDDALLEPFRSMVTWASGANCFPRCWLRCLSLSPHQQKRVLDSRLSDRQRPALVEAVVSSRLAFSQSRSG